MRGAEEINDEELMLSAQSGCVESFETLVSRHRITVIRFLMKMHSDIELVEDSCQETFLQLWIHRRNYTVKGRFTSYLLQIAKNVLLGRLRKKHIVSLDFPDIEDEANLCPVEYLINVEFYITINRSLETLPLHLSEVFRAVMIDRMKYAEAAELLDVPIGTIKSRMHEAIRRLRSALREEEL